MAVKDIIKTVDFAQNFECINVEKAKVTRKISEEVLRGIILYPASMIGLPKYRNPLI